MKRWFPFAIAIVISGSAGFTSTAYSADKLENIPLQWSPTAPMSERTPIDLSGLQNARLQINPFTDSRDVADAIGRNLNQAPVRKVSTKDDVPRFVTYQVKSLLSGLGLDVVESGGTVIAQGEVRKFFAEEGNRYNATVELRVSFSDPNGKLLWIVDTTGTSSRFGIGYKAANYYEVLSDALIGAVHELAGNPNFKKAIAGKAMAGN